MSGTKPLAEALHQNHAKYRYSHVHHTNIIPVLHLQDDKSKLFGQVLVNAAH